MIEERSTTLPKNIELENSDLFKSKIIFKTFMIYLIINIIAAILIITFRTPEHLKVFAYVSSIAITLVPMIIFLVVYLSNLTIKNKIILFNIVMVLYFAITSIIFFNQGANYTNILLSINIMILLSLALKPHWVYLFSGLALFFIILSIIVIEDNIIYYSSIGLIIVATYACSNIMRGFKNNYNVLTELNLSLERKVEEKTATLTATNEELEASLEDLHMTQDKLIESEKMASLTKVVSTIAHEVNTPIGVAITSMSYLEKEINTLTGKMVSNPTKEDFSSSLKQMRNATDLTQESLKRIALLVDEFKKINPYSHFINNQKNDINDLLEHFKVLNSEVCNQRNIKIITKSTIEPYMIQTMLFLEILSALFNNALQYAFTTQSEGIININISETPTKIDLSFMNNGHKISDDVINNIFEPFYTTGKRKNNYGLGLNIVYNIVTGLLKGSIELYNNEDTVEFVLSFPKELSENIQ
jgi:signal transduction histidine kinase